MLIACTVVETDAEHESSGIPLCQYVQLVDLPQKGTLACHACKGVPFLCSSMLLVLAPRADTMGR